MSAWAIGDKFPKEPHQIQHHSFLKVQGLGWYERNTSPMNDHSHGVAFHAFIQSQSLLISSSISPTISSRSHSSVLSQLILFLSPCRRGTALAPEHEQERVQWPKEDGMKPRWLILTTIAFLLAAPAEGRAAEAADEVETCCFGLLWCTNQEGDRLSRDGFFWLYSSEERGPYSRLTIRPFYSEELDPTKNLLRRSVLWPLGTYKRTGDVVSFRIVPLYWHGAEPGKRYSVIFPLYADYMQGDRAYTVLFPLYVNHAQGDYYRQRFFLGPLFITTQDTRRDFHRWDFLWPLGGHSASTDGDATWLTPVYFSGHHMAAGSNYRFFLPLYGHSKSPGSRFHFLFPAFGSTQDETAQLHRFSVLGLPPLPMSQTLPAFALYEHVAAPDHTSHRFFSFYRHIAYDTRDAALNVLFFYQHQTSAQGTADRLFPLYNVEIDRTRPARDLSVLGFRQWTLFRLASDPGRREHRLLGLYDYSHDVQDESSALGLLGYKDFSLFRYHSMLSGLTHRFFPLYRYRHDRLADETQFDALLLYRHLTTSTRTIDRLLPIWEYERAVNTHDWHISVLDADPLTLFHHESSDATTANHVFPFYGYRGSADSSRFSLMGLPPSPTVTWAWYVQERTPTLMTARLFPFFSYWNNDETHERKWNALLLYSHRSTETTMTDQLIPFHTYEEDRSNQSWQMSLFGIDPVTLFRYRASPVHAAHHVFPIYGYQQDGSSRRWTALGLPPMGKWSVASLIEIADDQTGTTHRFTPLYAYAHDREQEETSLNILYLYWYARSKQAQQHSMVPLGSLRVDDIAHEQRFTLLGLDPLVPASLVRHTVSPIEVQHLLFPLYEYRRKDAITSFSLGGVPEFSLFRHQTTPTMTRHRLFPIYNYGHDPQEQRRTLDVMLLYGHECSPAKTSTRFFPLWHYENNRDTNETRLGFVGWAPFSLYQAVTTPTQRSRRLFPLYVHRTDLVTGRDETDVVRPFLNVKRQNGETTEWSVLWWLAHYEEPTSESYEFRLFSSSKMAVLRRAVSPDRSSFDFSPVLPLYSYSAERGKGESWNFFDGLVGTETEDQGRTQLRLFWIRI